MEIIYKIGDFPDPGDQDVYNGIQELNKNNYQKALQHFGKGSNYNNEYALLFHAIIYFAGFGFQRRYPAKALSLFKKISSEWNNCIAQYMIGSMYLEGDEDIPQNEKFAAYWFSLAASGDWPYAILCMAECHTYLNYSSKPDFQKSIPWFERLAKNDDSENELVDEAPFYLFGNEKFQLDLTHVKEEIKKDVQDCHKQGSILPFERLFSKQDKTKLPDWEEFQRVYFWDHMTKKKSSGVLTSQLRLMLIYFLKTDDYSGDPQKGIYWAKKAGKNGIPNACTMLGKHYENGGDGIKIDCQEAISWYTKSGQLQSIYRAGHMFHQGKGVEKDDAKAIFYLLDTVRAKDFGPGHFLIGDIFRKGGVNVPQNYKKAFQHFEKAAENGCPTGASMIALLYYKGLGVKKSMKKMLEWFEKGKSLGCMFSSSMLRLIHLEGIGAIKVYMDTLECSEQLLEEQNLKIGFNF